MYTANDTLISLLSKLPSTWTEEDQAAWEAEMTQRMAPYMEALSEEAKAALIEENVHLDAEDLKALALLPERKRQPIMLALRQAMAKSYLRQRRAVQVLALPYGNGLRPAVSSACHFNRQGGDVPCQDLTNGAACPCFCGVSSPGLNNQGTYIFCDAAILSAPKSIRKP